MPLARAACQALDAADPLAFARERFDLPEGVVYLNGNSLGALPRSAAGRMAAVVQEEWGRGLIRSWNTAGWMDLPARVAGRIAPLIGADADQVTVADSTSVNLFKLAAAAVRMNAPRRVIVAEAGDFPTDLYVLQGLRDLLGDVELRIVPRDRLAGALTNDVALLVLTQVSYRTGAVHDLADLTRRAHAVGALTLWDLSHSAGVLDVRLDRDQADFAVGCGYKYLNGGPGAPAFLYVARRHLAAFRNPLSGWMGHAAPFGFDDLYTPAEGIRRALTGTPAVLGLSALEEGVRTFDGVDMAEAEAKARALGDLFLDLVEARLAGQGFAPACPRDGACRGGQVSLAHPDGYAICQALIERGVIGDFRAPDVIRFGFAPLYVRRVDVWEAVERLAEVMRTGAWREPRFARRAAVT